MTRTFGVVIPLACVALLAACATTESTQVAASDEGERTCRQMPRPGSNTPQRVCMTAERWKEYDRAEAAAARGQVARMQGDYYGAGFSGASSVPTSSE